MSELREECYKCLNNQKCLGGAEYGSLYCMMNRKLKMQSEDDSVYAHKFATMQKQIDEKDKRIKELEEYIFIAPDLDEMTAIKYANIQREGYIRGRADEQQRAEQIIYENYIPKQKVKDKIDEINKKYEDSKDKNGESPYYYPEYTIRVLKKLLEE